MTAKKPAQKGTKVPVARGPAKSRRAPAPAPVRVTGARSVKRKSKLPQTATTKAEMAMAQRLASLDPGTQRYLVLECAIEFKRSWVHLAKHLTEVARSGGFKEWGYRTFEAYAQHELHLRRETAQKLVRSFDFLSSHERPMLDAAQSGEGGDVVPLPNYQALDILAEARQNPYLAEDDYRAIRDQVFREDPPPSQLRKIIKERAPEPPTQATEDPAAALRKCLSLAERLYGILLEEDVPTPISRAVEEAIGGLRKLIEE